MPGIFPLGVGSPAAASSSSGGVRNKPHTVTAYPLTAQKTGDVRTRPLQGIGVSVACMVQADESGSVFNVNGEALSNPHTLLCEIVDAVSFAPNVLVTLVAYGITQNFRVNGEPELLMADSTGATNHAVISLERTDWQV